MAKIFEQTAFLYPLLSADEEQPFFLAVFRSNWIVLQNGPLLTAWVSERAKEGAQEVLVMSDSKTWDVLSAVKHNETICRGLNLDIERMRISPPGA